MKKEAFRQFQTIFKAGDKAGKVYLLVRGSVGIFLPDNDSKDSIKILLDYIIERKY